MASRTKRPANDVLSAALEGEHTFSVCFQLAEDDVAGDGPATAAPWRMQGGNREAQSFDDSLHAGR